VLEKEEKESSYEYMTMNWLLGNPDGSYKIKLKTLCNQIKGAPEDRE